MKCYESPAKINLNLKVLGKREDGFHEVETMMTRISLTDKLYFNASDSYLLSCDYPGIPLDETNLISRAVSLLEKETGKIFKYSIKLEKNIPHGAGLGGGSSNAASVLLALNELESLDITLEDLSKMGGGLGADVAFFIYEKTAICRGKGEIVEPIDLKLNQQVILFKPSFGVRTPVAYRAWQGAKEIRGINYSAQPMEWGTLVNDLEKPVYEKYRFLAELKMWLLERDEVKGALMSGSGSTVFAIIEGGGEQLIKDVKNKLEPSLWCQAATFL